VLSPILSQRSAAPSTRKLLSAGENLDSVVPAQLAAVAVQEILSNNLGQKINEVRAGVSSEDALLLDAERALKDRNGTREAVGQEEGMLGVGDIVASWFGLVDKIEGLRRALDDWLADDTTFDIDQHDDTYDAIIDRIGLEVEYVVTGHTHLAREIEFSQRFYYNCGTWIRLLRLTKAAFSQRVCREGISALAGDHAAPTTPVFRATTGSDRPGL
jgi:hypothetical protein